MRKPKIAVLVFPGTNCNMETKKAIETVGLEVEYIWHEEKDISKDIKAVVIPGGFSYGDYLEAGKMATFSPIMYRVKELAYKGFPVLGICNGFQVLCASGLLEGTLLMNKNGKFISKWVYVSVEETQTPFTCNIQKGDVLRLPIAHKYGNYYYRNRNGFHIVFKYRENPNGSMDDIAGITSPKGNIVALMPHPERAMGNISDDGKKLFSSLRKWFE